MDLVDESKEDLQERVRFLKDHVGKILPQAKFHLVTTSSGKAMLSLLFSSFLAFII